MSLAAHLATDAALLAAVPWTYPAILLVAIVVGLALLRPRQRSLPLTRTERAAIALGAFLGAMLGAKLPFVLTDPEGLRSGAVWFANGKTMVFGLAGAYLGVELAKWALDVRTKTGDSFAVPAAVTIAIGRWSCFVAGCCYGAETTVPWAVAFDGVRRHPTQIYESLFHAAMAGLLVWLERRDAFPGQRFKFYVLCYLGYRFVSEFLRPEPAWWLGWSFYQWAALGLMPVFAALWWHDARARHQATAATAAAEATAAPAARP